MAGSGKPGNNSGWGKFIKPLFENSDIPANILKEMGLLSRDEQAKSASEQEKSSLAVFSANIAVNNAIRENNLEQEFPDFDKDTLTNVCTGAWYDVNKATNPNGVGKVSPRLATAEQHKEFAKECRDRLSNMDKSAKEYKSNLEEETALQKSGAAAEAKREAEARHDFKKDGNFDTSPDAHDEGGDGFGCFIAGTPILMADGSEKPIERIKVGDRVMAFDGMGAPEPRAVTDVFHYKDREVLSFNGVQVTDQHRFFTGDGRWVAAGN